MTGLALAIVAAYGMFLLYTALALGWTGVQPGPVPFARRRQARTLQDRLAAAGLTDVRPVELFLMSVLLFALAALSSFALFGAPLPAAVAGCFAASFPAASHRVRRAATRAAAMEAWPRMLEELRILTGSVGRSIPQALFEVGRRAPAELRPSFDAAHREWLLSTDFERTIAVLKARLADPTADAACETLLVAHQVGGGDLDRRLEALVADRVQDSQGRKDARAKQAGVRFARRFVLIVPIGMAAAGLSVGSGRSAYQSAPGQLLVVAAIASVIGCWIWAGRFLRLPEEERVFHG